MVKKNEITNKKSLATLGQLQNIHHIKSIDLLDTDTQDALKRLVQAFSPPSAIEVERRRQLFEGTSERQRAIKIFSDQFIGHKIQAEFLKTFFPNPHAYFEEERLKSAKSLAETKKNIQEIENDSERAKKLLSFAGEFQDINLSDGLKIIEDELRENGALTSRQLVFLIAESIDKYQIALIETANKVIQGGKNGHEVKYGTDVEKENQRAMWQSWVDTEIAKYPNKKAHSFEFIKSLVVKNHPDNVSTSQLKRYTKDSRESRK